MAKSRLKKGEVEKTPDFAVGLAKGSMKIELLRDHSAARCSIEANVVDYRRDTNDPKRNYTEILVFDVASLWMHPTANEPLRMLLKKPRQLAWHHAAEIAKSKNNEIEYNSELYLRFDRSQSVIRFGYRNYPTIYSGEEHLYMYFYNSKSIAIRAMLEEYKTLAPVGGVDIVNFQAVDDELLSSMGMTKLPDVLGNSEAMWYGNPAGIADRGQGGSYQRSQNIASFIDMLTAEVAK